MLISNTHRAGTREVHNKLEKNRRAHLRECFEFLRKQLPAIDDKKLSNLGILKSALRHIQVTKTNTKKNAGVHLPTALKNSC
jgi:MAX-binding protein